MIEIGQRQELSETVTEKNVAAAVGSGGLPVYATPAMIALMERTAFTLLQEHLDEGQSSVGTAVNIKHLSATPIGLTVRSVAELVEIDRKRFSFKVEAFDDQGKIGEGTHERFVIKSEDFLAKAQAKLP